MFGNLKIEIILNSAVKDIADIHQDKVMGLYSNNVKRTSNAEIFKNQLKIDQTGLNEVSKEMQSSVRGVFAVGDISDALYGKAITAAGFGAMAAIEVTKFIEKSN